MFAGLMPPKPPRAKPRVMMHVTDGGYVDGLGDAATFKCDRCGHESDWTRINGVTDVRRGFPCPKCNEAT